MIPSASGYGNATMNAGGNSSTAATAVNVSWTAANSCQPFAGVTDGETAAKYIGNAILGLMAFLPNLTIAATILSSRQLRNRNDLIIFCAFSIGETVASLSIIVGFLRYFYLPVGAPCMTGSQCMTSFHVTPNIAAQFMLMMLCVISIDRMVCVTCFEHHQRLGKKYALGMVAVPLTIQGVSLGVAWGLAISKPPSALVNPLCLPSSFLPEGYMLFNNILTLSCAMGSVVIYGCVMVVFKVLPHHSEFEGVKIMQIVRERKITRLFGLLSLVTLGFFAIPQMIHLATTWAWRNNFPSYYPSVVAVLITCKMLHSFLYSSIFLSRPTDVRERLFYLIRRMMGIKNGYVVPVRITNSCLD